MKNQPDQPAKFAKLLQQKNQVSAEGLNEPGPQAAGIAERTPKSVSSAAPAPPPDTAKPPQRSNTPDKPPTTRAKSIPVRDEKPERANLTLRYESAVYAALKTARSELPAIVQDQSLASLFHRFLDKNDARLAEEITAFLKE